MTHLPKKEYDICHQVPSNHGKLQSKAPLIEFNTLRDAGAAVHLSNIQTAHDVKKVVRYVGPSDVIKECVRIGFFPLVMRKRTKPVKPCGNLISEQPTSVLPKHDPNIL